MHPTHDANPREEQTWSQDRRHEPRIHLSEGELVVELPTAADFLRYYALNISSAGMFIACDEIFEVGTRFHFVFRIGPDEEPLDGVAEVKWCRAPGGPLPPGMGVRFVELSPAARRWIERIIAFQRSQLLS